MDSIPRAEWVRSLDWRQGEHMTVVGETGTGKTTLIHDVLPLRDWTAIVTIKRRDDTLRIFKDYERVKSWPPPYGTHRAILDASPRQFDDRERQRKIIRPMMEHMFWSGGWTPVFDDTGYLTSTLGLKAELVMLLNQGRALGLSVVTAMTRPSSETANVPLEAFSQVRHTVLMRTGDAGEYRRMSQLARMPEKELAAAMRELGPHDFLAVSHGDRVIVRA